MYPHLTATDGLAVTWLLNRELGGNLQDPSPAIKRIREMKPYVTKFYTSNAEPGTALTSGEIELPPGPTAGPMVSKPRGTTTSSFSYQDQGAPC